MPKKNNLAEDDEHNDSASTSSNIQSKRRHSTTDQRTMLSKRVEKKQSKDDSKNSAARVGELKGLQDSLTKFFTPNEVRRSRSTFKASLDQPLEISIDAKFPMGAQSTDSFQSSKTGTSSHISPKSPHRRDKLEDSLSQYFTPNPNNKRRLHKEGEYWQLSRGDAQSNNGMSPDGSEHQNDNFADIKHENDDDERKDEKSRALSRQSRTQKSNQKSEGRKKSATASAADAKQSMKRVCVLAPRKENAAAIKLLKRAYKGARDTRRQMPVSSSLKAPNAPTSLKNSITNYFRPVKPLASSSTALEINIPQAGISEEDRALFEKARQAALKDLEAANNTLKQNPNAIFPPKIRIHCYEIDTWYSAPFPQEYACLPLLHICDACLMYLSVPSSHMRKCRQQFPPGNEIYRGSNFSIFEVDGNQARVYCRNLCLLAKLFIDHKTLYFDVEPFLFYVLTLNDETGCHFVGYFSKEKYSSQKFNLACIVTLPCYQGQGFGRFLIDFSYFLSRKEGLAGSPERPLSDLGRIAYQSYWLSAILEYFHGRLQQQQGKAAMRQLTLKEISILTGIAAHDIAETLAENLMLFTKNSKTEIVLDEAQILAHWEKAKRNKRRIWLDESKLQWTPKIYSPSKEFRLRSPTFTPLPSISSPNRLGAEMEKMEIGTNDEKQSSASAQKKGKSGSARRKVEMSPKTPKVSTGKIGRKKAPGKSAHESQSSSFEEEDEERKVPVKSTEKKAAEKQKKTKRTSCKETTEKRQKKRGTSSTDDEEKDQAEPRLAKQLSRSLTIATAQPSTSTARSLQKTSSHKCTISSSGHKHTARTNSMVASESGTEGEEEEKKEATTKSTTGGQKHIKVAEPPVKKGQKIFVKDADPESDNSSAASSIGARKKRRILKKRRAPAPKKRSAGSSSTAGDSSEEDNESVAATREGHGTTESKRRRKSIQQQHIDDESSDEDEEEEEEEEAEEHSCCSSASPQPIGDRLPIFKPPSLKEHDNMVNMGGEPDTVNMGGEPDDEDMDTTNNNSSETTAAVNSSAVGGISSYKTPVLVVAPHPMAEEESAELEAEEEENPSPMIGPQMKLLEQQQQQQTLLAQLSVNEQFSSEKGERQQQGNLTLSQSQPSFSQPPQTLKIPTIQADAHKSCSPSADVATVEMPALDAAERHISPSESHSRFGEEEPVEDDAPPMLSPQDGNSSTGNETTAATSTATMMIPIMPIPVRASAACENLLKSTTIAAESSHQTMLGGEELLLNNNTTTTSADPLIGLLSAERRLSNERSRENASQPLPAAQVETPRLSASAQPHQPEFQQNPVQQQQHNIISRTTIPIPVRATEELLNNTSALPQIRVRSESNVEFCTQLPAANKMQRTSSFSGGAAAMAAAAVVNKESALLPPMQPTLSTLSIPGNNVNVPNVPRSAEVVHPFVHQQQQQQQVHYAAMMQQQQHALSSFMAPAYSQQAYANAVAAQHQQQTQLPPQPQMPQQLPQQQQQPSKSRTKGTEKPAAAEKSKKSNKEKAKTATAKTSGTEKNKSPQKQLQPASQSAIVPSMPSTSAASAALQSHWAQFAQQYYQQQQQQQHNPYAYQMATVANRPAVAATAQQQQHQQQNAAAAAEFAAAQQQMGPYASSYNQLYNQAAAWQAWQMSAAAKFPAGQAAAAAGGYPYPTAAAAEFFNFNMANGGGVPSGSAAAAGLIPMAGPSAHPPAVWPAEFSHLRHPASAQSQAGGFYPHPHPPM